MADLAEVWQAMDVLHLVCGLAIFAGAVLLRYLVVALLAGWFRKQAKPGMADMHSAMLQATVSYGIVLAGLIAGVTIAGLPDQPWEIATYAWRMLHTLLIIYCGDVAYCISLGLVRAYLRRTRADGLDTIEDSLMPLMRELFKLVAIVLIVALGVQVWGYSPATLLTGVGIGGLALAFAAQDTIANIFGSFVIYSDKSFKVGDWVEIEGVMGIVEEIGIRSTCVRTFDKCLVTFPNKLISSEKLHNRQAMTQRRVRFHLGLSAANAPETIERALEDLRLLVRNHALVAEGMWLVYAEQVDDYKLGVLVQAYLNTTEYEVFLKAQEEFILDALKVLRAHGLSLAVPLLAHSEQPDARHLGVPRQTDQ